MIKAVIFDMDGTILNTIGDLTDSLNHALVETGFRGGHSEEMVKLCFGWAVRLDMIKAIAMARGMAADDLEFAGNTIPIEDIPATEEEIQRLQSEFTSYYGRHNHIKTRPYEGIMDSIGRLHGKGIRTAVASNKDDSHVQVLSKELFPGLFDVSTGNHPGIEIKPSPQMILEIADKMNLSADEIVYAGDSEVDILTGKNGGFRTISVTWGFRTGEFLRNHGAEHIASSPKELVDMVLRW